MLAWATLCVLCTQVNRVSAEKGAHLLINKTTGAVLLAHPYDGYAVLVFSMHPDVVDGK